MNVAHLGAGKPVLALDTSTSQAGIAVGGDGRVSALSWDAGRSHTVLMLDQVSRLLELHGVALADLAAVAVATGPGAFTGLRVGVSLAKGFSLALDLPLIGVSTLEATALPHLDGRRRVVAVVPAGRGRVVWAPFAGTAAAPQPLADPRNSAVAEAVEAIAADPDPVVVVGDFDASTANAFAGRGGVVVPPRPVRLRLPAALLAIALRRLGQGATDDAAVLEPIYVGR